MKNISQKTTGKDLKWLLFFYSVPSKPVNARMKIWRRLAKAGAVQLKGAIYILPYNEETFELCQWLVSEVTSMKGEGDFVRVDKIETMNEKEIIDLFKEQRERDYSIIEKELEQFERKISSIRKGTGIQNNKKLSEQFNKYLKEFEEIKKIDFFSSKAGNDLKKRIKSIEGEIKIVSGFAIQEKKVMIIPKRIEDYQGKTWVTRKNPFVDRMASAWLVKKFIDIKAVFKFIDEKDLGTLDKDSVAFDIRRGEFTHSGDMCTFEVLIKAFGLKDKALKKIAEVVHELDIKDDKYKNPEAKGIEDILMGIRKTAKDDAEILEKGMVVFEMLYASKT
ncbi:MAG: chromate resistance protein [Thermodesulfovibrionia bacterium]|nr:chromate resistance protein [Thermodesulfovibrionia bacterium]